MNTLRALGILVLAISASLCRAEETWSGFLCCNMRSDGAWITDINYVESFKHLIPAGSTVTITGYGHYRVKVKLENKSQAIGNDYSRDLSMQEFARRYVVAEDPSLKISAYPKKVQDVIREARVMKGMSREQVLMSLGYPVSSENPHLTDKVWRYWLFTYSEFKVHFDEGGRVVAVDGDQDTVEKMLVD